MKKGLFITFEGIEGCGKSTQAKLLYHHLRSKGYKCRLTHEPGGTPIGEDIRNILLDPHNRDMSVGAELLLFEASRAQLAREVILPSLNKGIIVICDRFNDSTYAYQAYAGGVDKKIIRDMEKVSIGALNPDLTIFLDVDVKTGLSRAKKYDRIEKKSLDYHGRVRKGFLALSREYPKRIKAIRPRGAIAATQSLIQKTVEDVIQRYYRPR